MNETITIMLTLHITASAIWLGTGIFTEFVLTPALKSQEKIYQASILSKNATRVAIVMVWISLISLSSTGLALMWLENWLSFSFLFGGQAGLALLFGIVLTLVGIVNGLVITLVLIPKKSAQVPVALRINMVLAMAIVVVMVLFYESVTTTDTAIISCLIATCHM